MSDAATEAQRYHHMNAGAHRRPPPQIGAPALTWQRGFWMPQDEARRRNPGALHASRWEQSVDNTLAHLFRAIRLAPNVAECTSPNYDPHGDLLYLFNHKVAGLTGDTFGLDILPTHEKSVRHVVFSMRARFCGLWLTMSARLHHENFVILFALDFSGEVDEAITEAPELNMMAEDLQELHDVIVGRYREHRKNSEESSGRSGRRFDRTFLGDRKRSELMSKKLIARFKALVERITADACDPPCNDMPSCLGEFGERFSDFFGIIYGLHIENGELGCAYFPEDEGLLRMSEQVGGTDFNSALGLDVLDAAWPVVTSADAKSDVDRAHGDPEYVVATFNGGRTLYVSSLGRLTSDTSKREFPSLIYTLIVSYSSPWRLGRFVDKLHTAGTLRLAAMRELEEINTASRAIDSLSHRLASDEDGNQLFAAHENIEAEFAAIGGDLELGLAYRIERSRYYVNSYNDTVAALRPARVQGYQFYVDFIRSRVFDAFDYIDRVGARYDNLKKQIEFRVGMLRRQEARDLLVATARQARAAASLLEAAELLSVIPLTYYAGYLLMEMVAPLRRFERMAWLPTEHAVYYIVGFLLSFSLAYFSSARRRRNRIAGRRQGRQIQPPTSPANSSTPTGGEHRKP